MFKHIIVSLSKAVIMGFLSFRWLKRVASSLVLLGLAVAIIILLLPGEHEKHRIQRDLNNTLVNSFIKDGGLQDKNITVAVIT